jgi:hypothetical protein
LRAMAPDEIAILTKNVWDAAGIPRPEIITVGDVGAALDQARACGDAPICVTGSIFVVADAREAWALYTGNNLPETDDGVASGLSALHPVSSPLQAVTPARSE